jgi:hypothetical protein
MSSTANTSFWSGASLGLDLGGYSIDFSAPTLEDATAAKPAAPVVASSNTTTDKATAGEWVTSHPLAVGAIGVGVLALIAIMASGGGK